ncbi:MAG: membrane integrity-associated transporter subunit PqiC [Burkholderiales bacterium]|nr:membrane integrity-associated transporter subunit PqiC [Burkholderiales bacterium]
MNKMRGGTCIAAAIAVAAAVAGCSIGPTATEPPATYDLGAPPAAARPVPVVPAVLRLPEVAAPGWLAGPGIVFRLGYETPARPQAYALSRWAAPPPALLTERLRSRFAAATNGVVTRADGVRADYLLRVELEEFSQSFDTPASSAVALRARATLVRLDGGTLAGQRTFVIERPSPTPDAPGAVRALSEASGEFVESLLDWTRERIAAARK